MATYRRYLDLVRVRADEAVREQRTKVQAAIGAERSRMAGSCTTSRPTTSPAWSCRRRRSSG
ncbi:hypothetical protein NKG94_05195 [Micromonospora sp. M12]